MDGESFVSIELNDDVEECDICHQATEEKIISVILSDEFTIFEGSYSKNSGNLTKAHQICLQRWSEVISRNLKSSKRSYSPVLSHESNGCPAHLMRNINNSYQKELHNLPYMSSNANCFSQNGSKHESKELTQLLKMKDGELKTYLKELQTMTSESSHTLVSQLQVKDILMQEISARNSLISQLVTLKRSDSMTRP